MMAYTERQQHMNAQTGRVLRGEGVGDFGVRPFEEMNGGGGEMGTAVAELLPDRDRGVGHPVERGKGMLPAQRQPDHGHHHVGHRRRG